ncbi:MAG: KAP family NTPase [Bacteroidia bacterium]|nr:KAP family NTPase [Bacteroidia bacterium]MCF8428397.1 KAP family NTPase [Bacteroidia bacterium]MCF8447956.1 KAP family NTPase [Bacteroidia bacterium]
MKNEILDLYKYPMEEFGIHFNLPDNDRIVFSGRFGMGKTTFLKHFFSKVGMANFENGEEFLALHIFPVNYSIATNDDIFDLIKYDILFSLISNDDVQIDFNSYSSFSESIYTYIQDKPIDIILKLLTVAPKVGKSIEQLLKVSKELKIEFDKFHSDASKTEARKLSDFVTAVESKHAVYDPFDLVTSIIENIIKRSGKNAVLIIDDLDRVDPEHIFRILNIFSAYFDQQNNDEKLNRFGLNKVIVVCDIENIHMIFKAKYGQNADFNGYIDKFYCVKPFNFMNTEAIKRVFRELVISKEFFNNRRKNGRSTRLKQLNRFDFFEKVLIACVERGNLRLRSLLRLREMQFVISNQFSLKSTTGTKVSAITNPILFPIVAIANFFGSKKELMAELEVLAKPNFFWPLNATSELMQLALEMKMTHCARKKKGSDSILETIQWDFPEDDLTYIISINLNNPTIAKAEVRSYKTGANLVFPSNDFFLLQKILEGIDGDIANMIFLE